MILYYYNYDVEYLNENNHRYNENKQIIKIIDFH